MVFAKAKFRMRGPAGSLEGVAVVDTGSLMSIIDEGLAGRLGLRYTGRTVRLTTMSGEEVVCKEALVEAFEVEDEVLVSERVAVYRLPDNVRGKLRDMNVDDQVIVGVITLEAAGFAVDPKTGRLIKVGWLALRA